MKKENIIWTIVIGTLCALVWFIILPYVNTKYQVERLADDAEQRDWETKTLEDKDSWGNNIKIKRQVSECGDAVGYMAFSAGRDGLYETDDDIYDVDINVNWSKKTGRALGKMSKEVAKGMWEVREFSLVRY